MKYIGIVISIVGLLVCTGYAENFAPVFLWIGLPIFAIGLVVSLVGSGCISVRR